MSHRKVLIVDDNADQGRPLALILKHSGYDAGFVTSGEAAMSQIHDDPPQLMILDLMMPGMSGLDVLKLIREDPRTARLPVIIYSAVSDEKMIDLARRQGANDFWIKVGMRVEEICHRVSSYFPSEVH
jgi:PleD family two-component response regulator